jgi:Xaa-Pro aminopeptidase
MSCSEPAARTSRYSWYVLALLLVGSDLIPIKYWRGSEAATPDVEWIVVDELIREVRLVKSARELTAFRCAGEIVSS